MVVRFDGLVALRTDAAYVAGEVVTALDTKSDGRRALRRVRPVSPCRGSIEEKRNDKKYWRRFILDDPAHDTGIDTINQHPHCACPLHKRRSRYDSEQYWEQDAQEPHAHATEDFHVCIMTTR